MNTLLFANLSTGVLSDTLGGSNYTFPAATQGDGLVLRLRLSERIGEDDYLVSRGISTVRAGIGKIDVAPTSGTFALTIEGVDTADLAYNISAADLLAEVETAVPGDGTITVVLTSGSWIIESAAELAITVESNALDPVSFVRFAKWTRDGRYFHEIRLQQAPVAFTDTWARQVPPAPTIVRDQAGSNVDGFLLAETQIITVPPDFLGSYRIVRDIGWKSELLTVVNNAEEIAEAIADLADENGFFNVEYLYDGSAKIEFLGAMEGESYDLLTVEVAAAPEGDVTFELDLGAIELAALFRETDSVDLPLEIELGVEDVHDDEIVRNISFRSTLTVREQLVRPEDATVQQVDWLNPPAPVDYVPFESDQIITGQQHYTFELTAATSAVAHNLDTTYTQIQLVRRSSGEVIPPSEYTATVDSANQITFSAFTSAPSGGSPVDGVITAAGPVAAFQSHTHTTAQVTGLDALLSDIGARLTNLEALAPVAGLTRADEPSYSEQWEIPRFFEVFPILGKVELDAVGELKEVTRAMLPKFVPALLPAVHQVTAATSLPVTTGILDAPSGSAGVLYKNNTGATVEIPLASPVETENDPYGYSFQLPANGYATHTGASGEWYPLAQYGTESSYYARNLERTLFHDTIAPNQLMAGRSMECRFTVEAQAIAANTPWHWHLVVETAQLTAATTPTDHGSATACTADHTTETFTATAHGLVDHDTVQIAGSVIPTGITAATDYYVIAATANTFQISATKGGTALAYSDNGTSVTFSKRIQPGDNLLLDDWYAEHVSQRLVLGASPRKYTLGYRVTRSAGGVLSAEQLRFGEWAAATPPESAEFAIRARLVRADVLNRVTSPRGFLAVLLVPGADSGFIKIS